jgi:hypothetical protein
MAMRMVPKKNLSVKRLFQPNKSLQQQQMQVQVVRTTTKPKLLRWHSSSSDSNSKPIRPYSESLPSPGFAWCERCHIQSHVFEETLGAHNTCLDRPRLFGLGVCHPAKQYFRQQVTYMAFLGALCFVALPGVTFGSSPSDDDEQPQHP